jgi:hypothetical protein
MLAVMKHICGVKQPVVGSLHMSMIVPLNGHVMLGDVHA